MAQRSKQFSETISIEKLLQGWRKVERGPKPRLTPIQLFAALYFVSEYAPLGRYDLADKIHENQGVTRGMLERLLENLLIESSKAGARITNKGRKVLKAFLIEHRIRDLSRVSIPSLVPTRYIYAVHLAGASAKASRVIEQRDVAVRMGASGAMTILRSRQGLTIPPDNESLRKLYPDAARILEATFLAREGDVILLAFGEDEYAALAGVLSVSKSVIG